jgi:peptidoglycan hydrolase-like protein with peptidoglycan-binding domain
MKPSIYRRMRRRPAGRDIAVPKKDNQQDQQFFGEITHEPFFKPVAANSQSVAVQRKCADCEKEDKVQRLPEKKEEEKKLHRAADKKKEEKIQKKEEKKEEEKVQKKEVTTPTANSAATASGYISSINGKGQSMEKGVQSFYESRMGADFSDVKIHTGKEAAESAKDINAQAYAYGNHIVFNEGKYQPGSGEGKHLLAHELTHVMQQGSKSVSKKIIQRRLNDGHDLTSPRFAGDLVLEGCYDNERTLRVGSKGAAVSKLQQALVDAGFPLLKYGVDGIFGNETETAVRDFQQKAVILVDGIVGPQTMGALDTQFGAPAPQPPAPAPAPTPAPVPSTITYSAPSERREDPIPKVLSGTSSLLGETLPKFNGTVVRTRQQAINILGPIFINNIPLVYDTRSQVCKIDVSQINLDVSADVQKLTVPSGKWAGTYPGSLVRNCGQNSTVNIEMDSPSGAAAFEQRIAADEQEHVDDLNRIAKNHFDAFYTYLAGISLPSTTGGSDCAALYTAEIGTKDSDMITAFLNDWQAAVALHDNAAGNHHHSTITDNRNCNLVKITVRN